MDIQINPEEKCVKLTEAVFNKYMKHLVQCAEKKKVQFHVCTRIIIHVHVRMYNYL